MSVNLWKKTWIGPWDSRLVSMFIYGIGKNKWNNKNLKTIVAYKFATKQLKYIANTRIIKQSLNNKSDTNLFPSRYKYKDLSSFANRYIASCSPSWEGNPPWHKHPQTRSSWTFAASSRISSSRWPFSGLPWPTPWLSKTTTGTVDTCLLHQRDSVHILILGQLRASTVDWRLEYKLNSSVTCEYREYYYSEQYQSIILTEYSCSRYQLLTSIYTA